MLKHVYSGTFVKATQEKNEKDLSLFKLRLTHTPSSATHFLIRIAPAFCFKNDGEKIAYHDDLFYFEHAKMHSLFYYAPSSINPSRCLQ